MHSKGQNGGITLSIPKPSRPQVWCTGCMIEGNHVSKCPRMNGGVTPPGVLFNGRQSVTIVYVTIRKPFHSTSHPTYMDPPSSSPNDYCDICKSFGISL